MSLAPWILCLGTLAVGACETPTYEMDVVVRNGEVTVFACEVGMDCGRNGFWWPQIGECSWSSDVFRPSKEPDCTPDVTFREAGTEEESTAVLPGATYEIRIGGCGHDAEDFEFSVPEVNLEILGVAQSLNEKLTVDFRSSGADALAWRSTTWVQDKTCALEHDLRTQVQLADSYPTTASLSAFATTARNGDFGVARLWVGRTLELPLEPRPAP